MTDLPPVPAGTVLRLAPGEWCREDRVPVWARTDVRVGRIHSDNPRQVWVTGHAIECVYESSTCVTPCQVLLVQMLAILRQVSQ